MNSGPISLRHIVKSIYSCLVPETVRDIVALKLAYEYRHEINDTRLTIIMKIIANLILVHFPLFYILRFIQRLCSEYPYYSFKDEIIQKTTRVIFTRSKRSNLQICLKIWQRTENEVCDDRLIVCSNDYLIEGLAFNRKFAYDIYLGVAAVIVNDEKQQIQRGRLIKHPSNEQLKNNERYALVMRTLKSEQRLDRQLEKGKIDISFLAQEIAQMHRKLEHSPVDYSSLNAIVEKLLLNEELFLEAMSKLSHDGHKTHNWIGSCLKEACATYAYLFEERYTHHHIKRCHGDLKATNLWIQTSPLFFSRPRLLALDCIDFKPEFCHIDTLSDAAMLAIDLERLHGSQNRNIATDFLRAYLKEMHENFDEVEPLLEYYMTEKAIVCAYVSILYDTQQVETGKRYLDIANKHARRLHKLMEKASIQRANLVYPPHAPLTPSVMPLSLAHSS